MAVRTHINFIIYIFARPGRVIAVHRHIIIKPWCVPGSIFAYGALDEMHRVFYSASWAARRLSMRKERSYDEVRRANDVGQMMADQATCRAIY